MWSATLGEDKTLSIASTIQDCATSGGTYADYLAAGFANAVVATGGTGGDTTNGVTEIDVKFREGSDDAAHMNRYMKVQVTPDLNDTTTTDTVDLAVCVVLGGADVLPAA
jgi:hypothetical protein